MSTSRVAEVSRVPRTDAALSGSGIHFTEILGVRISAVSLDSAAKQIEPRDVCLYVSQIDVQQLGGAHAMLAQLAAGDHALHGIALDRKSVV